MFQLLFEGDSLTLRCRAPRVAVSAPDDSEDLPARAHVFWGWSETILEPNSTEDITYLDPAKLFPSIHIDDRHLSDNGLLDSILRIPYVTRNHTGTWDCRLRSEQANLSRSIVLMIISDKTKYCSVTETTNNKGKYSWPRTIRGRTVKLRCLTDDVTNAFASYKCSNSGEWIDLNTDDCPYIHETTKILEQFSKINMTIARGSVLESAKRLLNYTDSQWGLQRFQDPMDVVFIARTIFNYLEFIKSEKDLPSMILDIISQTTKINSSLLQNAQLLDSSCSKMVDAAETVSDYVQPASQSQKQNLALEIFRVRTDNFAGITCSWFKVEDSVEKIERRMFQCNTANYGQGVGIYDRNNDAVIQIPASIFNSIPNTAATPTVPIQKLLTSVFADSSLFPHNKTQSVFQVTSPVIGTKVSSPIDNLTEPIYVMLRPAPYHDEISAPRPVWWDPKLNGGTGGWSLEGCQFSQFIRGLLVFTCDRLGYYGLLQNTNFVNDFPDENAGARFRISPPAFYVGGSVLFICVWINIVTYMAYGKSVQMARRARHALINTWLALSILCFIFTTGIYQTENYKICQAIGIAIHYFSLCVLLWMLVGASNMYKRMCRLSKANERNLTLPVDETPKVSGKPIMGLYFAGYGIAMIICGISGAINIREYASYSFCFFESGPALGALFVPTMIFLSFLIIAFIGIKCATPTADDVGHMSEGTQATENVDLDLLESSLPHNHGTVDRYHSISLSTPASSIQEDLEHSNRAQLKAQIIVVLLYLTTWTSAAVSVATPFSKQFLYEEEIFSIVYAISASLLGLFILFFYCIARSDVRQQWSMLSIRNFGRKQCCRSRSVSDSKEINNAPIVTYRQAPTATLNSTSRSNSQCSKNRPTSNGNMILKGATDLNMHTLPRTNSPNSQGKMGASGANVNFVLMHRQQFLHNPAVEASSDNPEVFYNPNQINVARKFFKKQKRLQKRNNFEVQRFRDLDCTSEVSSVMSFPRRTHLSIFSSGSKVNNTNIHVDRRNFLDNSFRKDCIGGSGSEVSANAVKLSNNNPNILSDSCNESDKVDSDRIIIGAENLRALSLNRSKVNNNLVSNAATSMVANIYTNIPETLQPQHEIVTMRADDKFDKQKMVFDEADDDNANDKTSLLTTDEEQLEPIYSNNFEFNQTHTDTSVDEHSSQTPPTCIDMESSLISIDGIAMHSSSPIKAMNTVGLPMCSTSTANLNESDQICSPNSGNLQLEKDQEYISPALEISSSADFISMEFTLPPRKIKSLDNVLSACSDDSPEMLESQARSISCTNVCLQPSPNIYTIAEPYTSSSPVLFSPSLCDINEVQSPVLPLREHAKATNVLVQNYPHDFLNGENTPQGSETNLYFSPEKLFHTSALRNFTSSPTNESDINYQNSELSIRSHELYAPQPDNDLNLTLTDENSQLFTYQTSEISDLDDDDDYLNCSQDRLLADNTGSGERMMGANESDIENAEDDDILNESQSSIDELYQQITRRSKTISSPPKTDIEEEDSSQCSVVSFVEPSVDNR